MELSRRSLLGGTGGLIAGLLAGAELREDPQRGPVGAVNVGAATAGDLERLAWVESATSWQPAEIPAAAWAVDEGRIVWVTDAGDVQGSDLETTTPTAPMAELTQIDIVESFADWNPDRVPALAFVLDEGRFATYEDS